MEPGALHYFKVIVQAVIRIFKRVLENSLPKNKKIVTFRVEKEEKVVKAVTVSIEFPIDFDVKSLSNADWDRMIERGQRVHLDLLDNTREK